MLLKFLSYWDLARFKFTFTLLKILTLWCCSETFDWQYIVSLQVVNIYPCSPSVCPCLNYCVCLWLMVAPWSTQHIFWTMISLDGSIRWRCWRKWGGEAGRGGGEGRVFKGGTGEGGVQSVTVWRGDEGDDGPPGTWLKCSFLPNLLLYFEKQQDGCQIRKEAGDGWSDIRALIELMNGISTLAKWLYHHGKDRGQQKW